MAIFPLDDILTTLIDGVSRALRIKGEVVLTNNDTQRIPTQKPGKVVTIANAIAITGTSNNDYNLITNGGMTEDDIRSYSQFKISIYSTHNQTADVSLIPLHKASNGYVVATMALYSENAILPANDGRLILQSKSGGVGVGANIKVIPALSGEIYSNLYIRVKFNTAPTSGTLTIVIEMQ